MEHLILGRWNRGKEPGRNIRIKAKNESESHPDRPLSSIETVGPLTTKLSLLFAQDERNGRNDPHS